ncbi:MAG: hypothetical protein IJL87_05680 [Clostridia bacterium]|nr:hypothetical protein [Clostridia bacterium]
MIENMTAIPNSNISVTIAGNPVGGIDKFTVRMGKQTVLVPSTTIPGAYVYTEENVHYIEIEREVYSGTAFSNLHNLSNFNVVTTCHGTTIRYTKCEIADIYEYFQSGGRMYEKIKIEVGARTVVT